MRTIFFSLDIDTVDNWKAKHLDTECRAYDDIKFLNVFLENATKYILIIDYDSVANILNKWISTNTIPNNVIVLERAPEIITGKMLISKGIRAYGNSKMLSIHYKQMLKTVEQNKIWTYPALTAKLAQSEEETPLSDDAKKLIENRLSTKEQEVVLLILKGLVNDAIASQLDIKTRTVKAHISAIFSKLHINDRVSLILLLK